MSNMKNASKYVVAHGAVPSEVLEFACKDFGRLGTDVEDMDDMVVTHYNVGDNDYYVAGCTDDELEIPIQCLDDHIANVPKEELMDILEEEIYHCCNTNHIAQPKLACRDGLPDCIHCNVYSYTYYGPNCVITCYYVALAD
jgi:hypothetical protein